MSDLAQAQAMKKYAEDLDHKMLICGVSVASIAAIKPSWPGDDNDRGMRPYAAMAAAPGGSYRSGNVAVNLDFDAIDVSYTFSAEIQFHPPFNFYCNGVAPVTTEKQP